MAAPPERLRHHGRPNARCCLDRYTCRNSTRPQPNDRMSSSSKGGPSQRCRSATKGKFRRAHSERRGPIGAKAIAYLGADRAALARLVRRQLRRELRRSGKGKAIVRTGEAAPLSLANGVVTAINRPTSA